MSTGAVNVSVPISAPSTATASGAAYGTAGDFTVNYGKPATLASLLGDPKSMLIGAVVLMLVLRAVKRKKG
jgi:hypothetical protein